MGRCVRVCAGVYVGADDAIFLPKEAAPAKTGWVRERVIYIIYGPSGGSPEEEEPADRASSQASAMSTPATMSISISHKINQSINQSVSPSVSQSINHTINQSVSPSVSPSVSQSINHTINPWWINVNKQWRTMRKMRRKPMCSDYDKDE